MKRMGFEMTDRKARTDNKRLAQWRVQWLIENSTSHKLLWSIDSFVLRNPPLRQAPNRYATLKNMKSFYLLFLIIPFVACANETRLNTPEEFGNEVLRLLNEGKKEDLINLAITKVQFDALIESFDNPSDQKNSVKALITEESHSEIEQNISNGFERYRTILSENGAKNSTLEKVINRTSPMKLIPFQMGEIEIDFSTGNRKYTLSIESIKSLEGWRILDDFHIYDKNQ